MLEIDVDRLFAARVDMCAWMAFHAPGYFAI